MSQKGQYLLGQENVKCESKYILCFFLLNDKIRQYSQIKSNTIDKNCEV